jgi:hypothetical protein
MLFTIKMFAAAVAGILGVLGVVTDFRDKQTHRLTKYGRGAVILIVFSLFTAIGSELVERSRELEEKRQAEIRRTEEISNRLEENNRLLSMIYASTVPLGDVEATLVFDAEYSKYPGYAKRLEFLAANWKKDDTHFGGFPNTDFAAPWTTVQEPNWVPVLSSDANEARFARSLIPKPNTALLRVQRGARILEGNLHFGPTFFIRPLLETKHLRLEYTVAHVEWSNPTKEDASLFNLSEAEIEIVPAFHPEAVIVELRLRVPSSNHRLVASGFRVTAQTPLRATGTLKTP